MGCGGRGSVGRAGMFAGRVSVSDRQRVDERRLNASAKTSAGRRWLVEWVGEGSCVRQNRVVLAPVAGVKSAEVFAKPNRVSQNRQFADDGGKRNSSPGRAQHKPSTHCAGKAGCSPLDLYARVRTSLSTLHTRPRVQRAPGLPCALIGRELRSCLGRVAPRDRGFAPYGEPSSRLPVSEGAND